MRAPTPARAGGARRAVRALAAAGALALLAGCNTLVAQNPRSAMLPVNAVRWIDEPRLMLGGRDLVAYFDEGRSLQGSAQLRVEYELVAFHFVSSAHRDRFAADPAAYLPAYHGFCAASMRDGVVRAADPSVFVLRDGRLFLFADAAAKASFQHDPATAIVAADRWWREQVLGHNVELQRVRNWVAPPPKGS